MRRELSAGMLVTLCCLLPLAERPALAQTEYRVEPGENWSRLAERLGPGDTVVLLPGEHRPASLSDLTGTPEQPITIRGTGEGEAAVIAAVNFGLHLQRPRWVVLEDLTVAGARQNGINIDDQDGSGVIGEPWEANLTLRRVTVRETGPSGNFDGIKLSGLRSVMLEDSLVEGWGGSAVDMVGCHDVRIEDCVFRGVQGYSQSSGVQIKGGSSFVRIERCRFEEAGMRAVNLGGSTGLEYFRPPVPEDAGRGSWWEAQDVTVERCVFVDGECAVAIVGARGAVVRACTIVGTRRWPFRLLQETTDARFGASEGGLVSACLISPEAMRAPVNIGAGTSPEAFRWEKNLWWGDDLDAARLRGVLPGSIVGDQTVQDPRLDEQLRPREPRARGFGAGG